MFGHYEPPKPKRRTCPRPVPADIWNPYPNVPGTYAHMGRESNTLQHVEMLIYKQKKDGDYTRFIEEEKKKSTDDRAKIKSDKHAEKSRFHCEINKRLRSKIKEYDESIEKRRQKLNNLLADEEKEFIKETIYEQQRGGDNRFMDMKIRGEQLAAKREDERLKVVEQKKLQQYMGRCVDLRDIMSKKNTVEAKQINLQQMRENEARRQMEREMDRMYYDIMMKDVEAKKEREIQEALDVHEKFRIFKQTWDLQLQAKELLDEEARKIAEEDKIEMEKLREQLQKEELNAMLAKQRKKDELDAILRAQVQEQAGFKAKRKEAENALDQAFIQLTQLEVDRERAKASNTQAVAKKEMAMYRQSLAALNRQKEDEERQLDEMIREYQWTIQKKSDDAKCKIEAAKKKLLQDTLKGIGEQIEQKKELARQQLRLQEADNEMTRVACEANDRLEREMARQAIIAREQYKEDLLKQIEYNREIKRRERKVLQDQLNAGHAEEERYRKMVDDLCSGKISFGMKHPFRKALERHDCTCPEPEVIAKPPY